jgi:hypothetical protein
MTCVALTKDHFLHSKSVVSYRGSQLSPKAEGNIVWLKITVEAGSDWTGLKFSPDGKLILISTNGDHHKILDSFTGQLIHNLTGFNNPKVRKLSNKSK